jgi:tRNA(Leu) C34 or U34 (ribose-2'-O)-methylase TrmL
MNEKMLTVRRGSGRLPAVILVNPKYAYNVAGTIRACSAFGVPQLWVTGDRVQDEITAKGKKRLPREERMKLYSDVETCYCDYPFDACRTGGDIRPYRVVAVEIDPSAQPLTYFTHPEEAVYVFGPEDGSLSPVHRRHCTDFVYIPTRKDDDGKPVCVNLSAAVNIVLAHRAMEGS